MKSKSLFIEVCITIIVCLIPNLYSFAQAPDWAWAKNFGGDYTEMGRSVTVDLAGNIYVAGMFGSDSVTFGSTTLINPGIVSKDFNILITKLNDNGSVLWAKSAGGDKYIDPTSITTDNFGNVYVVGSFNGDTITFGSFELTKKDTGNYDYNYDMFIAKYDAVGTLIWAKSVGGNGGDNANTIIADAFGNIYIVGSFYSNSIIFDSDTLTHSGMFVVKYDSDGNTLWAKNANGSTSVGAVSIAINPVNNNVCVVGGFSDSISLDSFQLISNGYSDMFIAEYDTSGNVIWAKNAGGYNDDGAISIAIDNIGFSYVLGSFNSSVILFGGYNLMNTSPPTRDLFVAKYDTLGNVLWAKNAEGVGTEFPCSISIDTSGNTYITGYYTSPLTFGTTTLPYLDYADIFLAKYNSDGNVLWAKSVNTNIDERSYSIAVNTSGNVYITGFFSSNSISFDSNILYINGTSGSSDMFLAKLDAIADIEDIKNTNSFTLYPNPANDNIIIENTTFKINDDEIISIYNIQGQLLLQQPIKQQKTEINISSFAGGMYYVKVENEKGIAVKKFIKD